VVCYAAVSVADAKIISSAPFVLTSSFWNRISARTFFRSRMKRESMRGDCPRTGVYISA
jgi:hypothetical protein